MSLMLLPFIVKAGLRMTSMPSLAAVAAVILEGRSGVMTEVMVIAYVQAF